MPEEDPEPRDVVNQKTTHDEAERLQEQEEQPEPESVEAPDAG